MRITKVWLNEKKRRCIACGLCEVISPEVFKVTNSMTVKRVNYSLYENEIKDAVEGCPQNVIECK